VKLAEIPDPRPTFEDSKVVVLAECEGTIEELVPDNLWMVHTITDGIVEFAALEFFTSPINRVGLEGLLCTVLVHGSGPSMSPEFRECRHTYWGDDGYIYYLNAKHIRAVLDWLERHFDCD
jgi:hypothetical protein